MSDASVWDRLAGSYARSVRLFDRSYPAIRQRLADDLAGSRQILEVAAGTGQFTFELAAVSGCEALVSTDVAPKMIAQLNARLLDAGPATASIETQVLSAYELPFGDQHFDAVFCANALHIMSEPARALAEFRRVLKPGGKLLVPTFCHGIDRRRRALSRFLSLVSPFMAHIRFTPASLVALVECGGFRTIDHVLLPGLFPVLYLLAAR